MITTASFVSVIMPIRNEAAFIERSLGAVLQQSYPHDRMEVLIADGMSDDKTREIIQHMTATADIAVTVVDNPGRIVPTGFNAALRQAKGEIIVRVDGHTLINPDYVHNCVQALVRNDADNVGGRMNAVGNSLLAESISLATSSPFGVGGARFHYSEKKEWVDTVYMGAWPREVFERIGYFDEELVRNQDDEFNYRLRANSGKILLDPAIKSIYYNRASLNKLWKQYHQYGIYKVRVMQKHPQQMRPRQFVPVTFVSVLIGSAILGVFTHWGRSMFNLVIGSYILANLAATFITARGENQKYRSRLPLIFAILHISYGLGFLRGLYKFRDRWGDRGV